MAGDLLIRQEVELTSLLGNPYFAEVLLSNTRPVKGSVKVTDETGEFERDIFIDEYYFEGLIESPHLWNELEFIPLDPVVHAIFEFRHDIPRTDKHGDTIYEEQTYSVYFKTDMPVTLVASVSHRYETLLSRQEILDEAVMYFEHLAIDVDSSEGSFVIKTEKLKEVTGIEYSRT